MLLPGIGIFSTSKQESKAQLHTKYGMYYQKQNADKKSSLKIQHNSWPVLKNIRLSNEQTCKNE